MKTCQNGSIYMWLSLKGVQMGKKGTQRVNIGLHRSKWFQMGRHYLNGSTFVQVGQHGSTWVQMGQNDTWDS